MIGEGADKLSEIGTSDLAEELLASKSSDSGIIKKLFETIAGAGDTKESQDEDENSDSNTLVDKLQWAREKTNADGEDMHKVYVPWSSTACSNAAPGLLLPSKSTTY
jgi:hypothetical protein